MDGATALSQKRRRPRAERQVDLCVGFNAVDLWARLRCAAPTSHRRSFRMDEQLVGGRLVGQYEAEALLVVNPLHRARAAAGAVESAACRLFRAILVRVEPRNSRPLHEQLAGQL